MNHADFWSAEPFPHVVIDDLFDVSLLTLASKQFDDVPLDAWYRYEGRFETGKTACNRWDAMPSACKVLLEWMTSATAARLCEAFTGIRDLQSDPTLYGGGLHATEARGFLGLHLDNEIHPTTTLARRLNLIVYCNEEWREDWGGHLELWDRQRKRPVKIIAPVFNRAVLFETSSHSFHGHTKPLACPAGIRRKSLAVYYWSPLRRRAGFFAAHGEQADVEVERERLERCM